MDPYGSPYIIPNNKPYNPFPHSLLSTRERRGWLSQLGGAPVGFAGKRVRKNRGCEGLGVLSGSIGHSKCAYQLCKPHD